MDLYTKTSYRAARVVTNGYSTSFSSAIRLINREHRDHIHNIYGVVRIADEIVDTYNGRDALQQLNQYEATIMGAVDCGYSTDVLAHAYASTVRLYSIDKAYIKAFFVSMRLDINLPQPISKRLYDRYIYGSAEVVGLMCLTVFCGENKALFNDLKTGAKSLGAAFQKINFLRDIGDDSRRLGRDYFLNTKSPLTDKQKKEIEQDISKDFAVAHHAIWRLPINSRRAVYVAYRYYHALAHKISGVPIATLYERRIRISNMHKTLIVMRALLSQTIKNRWVRL